MTSIPDDPKSSKTPTPPEPPAHRRAHRPGRGVQSRKADSFRAKQNQAWDDKRKADFSTWTKSLQCPESIFDPQIGSSVIRRPKSIAVSTDYAISVVYETVRFLYSCKIAPPILNNAIPPFDYDLITLLCVTCLQVEAKMMFASFGTACELQSPMPLTTLQQMASQLKNAIRPISFYLSTIGKTVFDGREFYPAPEETASAWFSHMNHVNGGSRTDLVIRLLNPPPLPERSCPTGLGVLEAGIMQPVYFRVHALQPACEAGVLVGDGRNIHFDLEQCSRLTLMEGHALGREFVYTGNVTMPPLIEIFSRYRDFMDRVGRGFKEAFVDCCFLKGQGSNAQLVGLKFEDESEAVAFGLCTVLESGLTLGGRLGLGWLDDHFHDYKAAHIGKVMDISTSAAVLVSKTLGWWVFL